MWLTSMLRWHSGSVVSIVASQQEDPDQQNLFLCWHGFCPHTVLIPVGITVFVYALKIY